MENLIELIKNIKNNQKIKLEKNVYHITQEECFFLTSVFCSNSSSLKTNPNGEKHSLFLLEDKKNVVIDGSGSTIILHGPITPFLFNNCQNIEVKNIKIIKPTPTTLEFRVKESSPGEAIISIPKDNLYFIKNNNFYWYENNEKHIYWKHSLNEKDTITMMFLDNNLTYSPFKSDTTRFPSLPKIKSVKEISFGLIKLNFEDNSLLPLKSTFQIRHTMRNEIGGLFMNSKNISFKNIYTNFTGDMGYVFQTVKEIKLNHFDIKPNEGRIISSQADFFHFSNCSGRILVECCECSGAQDDVINVHGIYMKLEEINKEERSIMVKFPHSETFGFDVFFPGDEIGFVKHDTLEIFHKNIVKSAEKTGLFTQKLYLENDICDVNLGKDAVDNLSKKPSVIIRYNIFKNVATRAILSTTNKTVKIYDNLFENITMPLLYVSNDCNYWFESGKSGKIYFINNHIIDSSDNDKKEKVVVEYDPIVLDKNYNGFVHKALIFKDNNFMSRNYLTPVLKPKYLEKLTMSNNRSKKDFIVE